MIINYEIIKRKIIDDINFYFHENYSLLKLINDTELNCFLILHHQDSCMNMGEFDVKHYELTNKAKLEMIEIAKKYNCEIIFENRTYNLLIEELI